MTYEDWVREYKPERNHLNDNASFDGLMFETFGEELYYVLSQNDRKIWTWVDDGEFSEISEGYRLVNRMGYFVTEVPYPENQFITINLEE